MFFIKLARYEIFGLFVENVFCNTEKRLNVNFHHVVSFCFLILCEKPTNINNNAVKQNIQLANTTKKIVPLILL